MKNRRIFIGIFLFIALAFLGLGFAKLTNTLEIGGTLSATKNDENLKVEFVSNEKHALKDGAEDTSFTISASQNGQSATINVNQMSMVGQTAVVTFKVQNNSEALESLKAELDKTFTITMQAENGAVLNGANNVFQGDHFKVTVEYVEGTAGTLVNDVPTLASGQHVFVKVTIVLVNAVTDTLPVHTLTVSFKANTLE